MDNCNVYTFNNFRIVVRESNLKEKKKVYIKKEGKYKKKKETTKNAVFQNLNIKDLRYAIKNR